LLSVIETRTGTVRINMGTKTRFELQVVTQRSRMLQCICKTEGLRPGA
jgi:hypothetical protein